MNIANTVGPASTRITRAFSCGMLRIVLGEVAAIELGDRAGALHAGRAAADDDDVEGAVVDEARVLVRRLPPLQQVLLEADGIGQRVHRERVLGRTLGPEEVDLGAEREHEDVVGEGRHLGELHLALLEVDRGHRRHVHRRVLLAVDEVAQRVAHRARLQEPGRELVEERLEGVVVVGVDQHDVRVGVLELLHRAEPAEAAAEHEDARAVARAHDARSTSRSAGRPARANVSVVSPVGLSPFRPHQDPTSPWTLRGAVVRRRFTSPGAG